MLSFFPRDVLDEIWDLNESVSEGFPSYPCHGIGEQTGESRFVFKSWLYFRSFNAKVKVIVFVMNAKLQRKVYEILKCKYQKSGCLESAHKF